MRILKGVRNYCWIYQACLFCLLCLSRQTSIRDKCQACALRNRVVKNCSGGCAQSMALDFFTKRMWMLGDDARKCMKCMERPKRGTWACIECKVVQGMDEYSLWLAPRARKENDGTACCNSCKQRQFHMQSASMRDSITHVTKKAKTVWATCECLTQLTYGEFTSSKKSLWIMYL